MNYRKVTAIVRPEMLEDVERKLQALGIGGVTVTKVKGYGEYADFYSPDWMLSYARIEVFVDTARAPETAGAIMDVAHTGISGDGLVAVAPVEQVYRIRTRAPAGIAEL